MFWHSFECSNSKCPRDPSGLIMDIRTGTEMQPKGVKCPHCQRYPRYRGYWPADEAGFGSTSDGRVSQESLVRTLRKFSRSDLTEALKDMKIADDWVGHKDNKTFILFQYGLPFHAIASVRADEQGWEGLIEGKSVVRCADSDTAKHAVQDHLVRECGYVFPLN